MTTRTNGGVSCLCGRAWTAACCVAAPGQLLHLPAHTDLHTGIRALLPPGCLALPPHWPHGRGPLKTGRPQDSFGLTSTPWPGRALKPWQAGGCARAGRHAEGLTPALPRSK
eukprot:354394-Chlamydomonas_euryale.AAC.2